MNDGTTRRIVDDVDITHGAVVRMLNDDGTVAPFSDAIVLGPSASASCPSTTSVYKLARPYAFVSGAGTSCPTTLQGCEVFEVTLEHLRSNFALVLDSRGRVFNFVT